MKSERRKCDICSKEIETATLLHIDFHTDGIYDLCSSCYNDVKLYIQEKEKK